MADQSRRSNRKRTLKSEQTAPVAKRQKQEKHERTGINGEAEGPITNICNELIDRIFDFLDITSLLNVAGTCKRFQMAAFVNFGQKCATKKVHFIRDKQKLDGITVVRHTIEVVGLRCSLPFLRCFGAKISNVEVINANKVANKGDNHLERYINQYCAQTLVVLFFRHWVFSGDNFSKPFQRVAALHINGSGVGKQFPSFAKLFPNLRHLDLYVSKKFIGVNKAAVSFPRLYSLHVGLVESPGHLNSKCVTKLLHANPQLKHFAIRLNQHEKDFGQLLSMLSKNSALSILTICGTVNGVTNAAALYQLQKQHALFESLELQSFTKLDDVLFVSRQLNFLKSFSFRLGRSYECDILLIQLDKHWQHVKPIIHTHNDNCHDIILRH